MITAFKQGMYALDVFSPRFKRLLVTLLCLFFALGTTPLISVFGTGYEQQGGNPGLEAAHSGDKDSHRADPCELEPPGNALGRDRRCPPRGSSSGIAKGDFNGDGIGDLAIGAPFEDIGNAQDAGAVNVIYGSAAGLAATAGPGDQFFGYTRTNGGAGSALAAGDFNRDGYSDLAIGAPFDDVPSAAGDGTVREVLPFVYSNIRDGSSDTIDVSETVPASQQKVVQDAGRVHV